MASASRHLDGRQAAPAVADQQAAIDELEKIWDAVIPFHPLLARDLADQTKIARALTPATGADSKTGTGAPTSGKNAHDEEAKTSPKVPVAGAGPATLATESEDLAPLAEMQERTLRRTQLLKLKAEADLTRLEKAPPPAEEEKGKGSSASGKDDSQKSNATKPTPVDPKLVKAGYQKAIELAPKAADQMERAIKGLKQKNAKVAFPPAEDARKFLEEIQKAQPRQDQDDKKKEDQKKQNQDQQKQDQNKKNEDKQKQEQKDDQQKKEQQQKDEAEKKEQQKKEQDEQKKQDEANKSGDQKQQQQQPQVSRDQIEDALRKVRERQQEKRERDRMMKARVLGRVPVEKDW